MRYFTHPDFPSSSPRTGRTPPLIAAFLCFLFVHGGRLLADSYQYQLQSMWQKCWNTNQSLVHNLRFRERGPLKSWRPETMAEAIFSVLKEGLSLSQAARYVLDLKVARRYSSTTSMKTIPRLC